MQVKVDAERLRERVAQSPDATAAELHVLWGVDCGVSAVDHALRRLGLTRKKRRKWPPSRTART